MTDILLKPEDTGDIPRVEPDMTTRNLAGYALNPPPMKALRMADATGEIPRWYNADEDFTTAPTEPPKLPPPPPPAPRVDDRPLSVGEEIIWDSTPVRQAYVGLHRRPSRWDWLTVPLSMAAQRVWRSM
jgi:hypothetical protein